MNKILTMEQVHIETLKGVNLNFLSYGIKNSNDRYIPVVENCINLDLPVNDVIDFIKDDEILQQNLDLVAVSKKGALTFNLCFHNGFLPYFLLGLSEDIIKNSKNKSIFIDFINKGNQELRSKNNQFFNITLKTSNKGK
jgi:hypothetical protein